MTCLLFLSDDWRRPALRCAVPAVIACRLAPQRGGIAHTTRLLALHAAHAWPLDHGTLPGGALAGLEPRL